MQSEPIPALEPLPRTLYREADRLDTLGRRQEINSPVRGRLLDLGEELRQLARLQMRLGDPY